MKNSTPSIAETGDSDLVARAYNLGLKIVPNMAHILTREDLEYWEKNLGEIKNGARRGFVRSQDSEIILPKPAPPEKFGLLADLGITTVPDDYVHGTHLDSFKAQNEKKFRWGYNENITDANFPNPSRVLKPGDKLRVRAFKQIVPDTTTSKERMMFLAKQERNIYTGAQGASLVWKQKRDQLPKGYWYASFDEKDRLWEDADGVHRVPGVRASSVGDFDFSLGYFGSVWDYDRAFLSFCDEE